MDKETTQPAPVQDSTCNETLLAQGKAYPRTCKKCRLGPCVGKPNAVNTPPAAQPEQEPVVGWKNAKHPHNFGKPMGYAVITNADGRLPLMLDGGAHTFRSEAEAVLKRPEYADTHHIVELSANFPPAAQPAQEPVAWMYQSGDKFGWRDEIQFVQPPNHPVFRNVVALYTAPAQRTWVWLTDDQINQCGNALQWGWQFARAIEAKSKEINTCTPPAAQPEQEPVGTVQCINGITIGYLEIKQPVGTKLYTTPPPAQPAQERNFCSRCGKRTADLTVIHTCTPPQEKNT